MYGILVWVFLFLGFSCIFENGYELFLEEDSINVYNLYIYLHEYYDRDVSTGWCEHTEGL